ncbi:FAD-binding oxidoreductase [Bacteroidetes/Chlorobi group bacterium ChocPot_Mid]|nr:MAG: FAD-binding oxidoreductase [Bacteroidetes/Chlorobi group bacterium ChocPot_Mid]
MNQKQNILNKYESWGRFPRSEPREVVNLFWRNEIPDLNQFSSSVLAYAYGKSYGDSCQNDGGILLDTKGLSRLISWDRKKGIIRCESGVTLAEILDFAVPQGWFLASTPGTKYISVGGALANDVHGKNHHKNGTFGCHVIKFELIRSNGERLICSEDENYELFCATIGGLGLTGLITWVEFKLQPCPSSFFAIESIKFDSLEEFFEINEESEVFDYTVSWVDTTATGSKLGRGIYNRGNHANPKLYKLPDLPKPKQIPLPIEAPFINSCTVNVFNMLYYNKQMNKVEKQIVHYDPFFYPLDAVVGWNRAYGKNGFIQYQFVVPFERGKETIQKILRKVSDSGMSSFLTVLKTFGYVKSPGMLSFPRPGITMAVDFRYDGQQVLDKLKELDVLVREAGGVIYPAKDSRMSSDDFQRFYPNWKEFSEFIDPKFSSSFWRRVTKS